MCVIGTTFASLGELLCFIFLTKLEKSILTGGSKLLCDIADPSDLLLSYFINFAIDSYFINLNWDSFLTLGVFNLIGFKMFCVVDIVLSLGLESIWLNSLFFLSENDFYSISNSSSGSAANKSLKDACLDAALMLSYYIFSCNSAKNPALDAKP